MRSPNHTHLVSLNLQVLRDRNKRLRVLQWLKNQNANIVFLQETHFTEDIIDILSQEFDNWRIFKYRAFKQKSRSRRSHCRVL